MFGYSYLLAQDRYTASQQAAMKLLQPQRYYHCNLAVRELSNLTKTAWYKV